MTAALLYRVRWTASVAVPSRLCRSKFGASYLQIDRLLKPELVDVLVDVVVVDVLVDDLGDDLVVDVLVGVVVVDVLVDVLLEVDEPRRDVRYLRPTNIS